MLTLGRILPLLVAAILAVAAWALPSTALAHSGHDAHSVAKIAAGVHHAGPAAHLSDARSQVAAPVTRPLALTSSSSDSDPATFCTGAFCCGMASGGCCGGVLTAFPPSPPLPALMAGTLGPAKPSRLAGSNPDTLLKPPKSFV